VRLGAPSPREHHLRISKDNSGLMELPFEHRTMCDPGSKNTNSQIIKSLDIIFSLMM
jgi:hypothetical protein